MRQKTYTKRHFFALILILSLLASGLVATSNSLIALDTRLEKVREVTLTLQPENELIRQKIASASALSSINDKAKENGFTNPPEMINLLSSSRIAFGRLQ